MEDSHTTNIPAPQMTDDNANALKAIRREYARLLQEEIKNIKAKQALVQEAGCRIVQQNSNMNK
jgi:hypothetical protein